MSTRPIVRSGSSAACTCDPEAYDLGPEGQRRYFPDRGCPQHGDQEWIAAQQKATPTPGQADPVENAAPLRYRRRPDVVEAMKYDPSDPVSFQGVLSWLRDEGQKSKTVGRQVWVEWGDRGEQFVLHPGDYLIRKTEGRRFFYVESAERFEEARERAE